MPPVGFEPTFSADERPQTNALDRAATGTKDRVFTGIIFTVKCDFEQVQTLFYRPTEHCWAVATQDVVRSTASSP